MGAFEDFLKKQGYVKLDHYGLVLTPDDRILSTRPAVLDDGLGGKIVGWTDGDLAAAELDHWGAAKKPAAAKPVAANAGLRSIPLAPPPPAPKPVGRPVEPIKVAAAPQVAAPPPVEEDEWEWEIAMARARAAADDVQTAASAITSGFTAPKAPIVAKATPKPALAAGSGPVSQHKADPMSSWPVTEPLHETWEATRESPAPQVMSPAAKSLAVAKSAVRVNTPVTPVAVPLFEAAAAAATKPSPASQSRTVIPVPALPVAARPSDVRPAVMRTRIARGTDRPPVPKAAEEQTVVTAPVQPAHDDLTSPYVMLPPEVKSPPGYAHTKRVAAKYR